MINNRLRKYLFHKLYVCTNTFGKNEKFLVGYHIIQFGKNGQNNIAIRKKLTLYNYNFRFHFSFEVKKKNFRFKTVRFD